MTRPEYYRAHRETILQSHKDYRERNKAQISQRRREAYRAKHPNARARRENGAPAAPARPYRSVTDEELDRVCLEKLQQEGIR